MQFRNARRLIQSLRRLNIPQNRWRIARNRIFNLVRNQHRSDKPLQLRRSQVATPLMRVAEAAAALSMALSEIQEKRDVVSSEVHEYLHAELMFRAFAEDAKGDWESDQVRLAERFVQNLADSAELALSRADNLPTRGNFPGLADYPNFRPFLLQLVSIIRRNGGDVRFHQEYPDEDHGTLIALLEALKPWLPDAFMPNHWDRHIDFLKETLLFLRRLDDQNSRRPNGA